jgi:Geranylgeranyl pyrophosphate synthase
VNLDSIKQHIPESWKAFGNLFYNSLSARYELMRGINDYTLQRTGKQLRPLLCLLIAHAITAKEGQEAADGPMGETVIRCSVSSEMIHTATLLHDDVADEASMRRGMPSVRSLYSPSASVLLGDFWLSRAIAIIIETHNFDIFNCFAKSIEDLAEGEMLEIQKASDLSTTYDDYIKIIRRKTSSLFMAATVSAAYAVGASQETIDATRNYAYHLGLAFQMRDDIFDYTPALNTGKKPGGDLLERKITLPLLGAFESASQSETEHIKREIFSLVANPDSDYESEINAATVADIYSFIKEKGGIEYSNRILATEGQLASQAISSFPDSVFKRDLISLADYVRQRNI